MKKLILLALVLFNYLGNAQVLTCCSKPSGMAAMAKDPEFIAAHKSPLPFNYVNAVGKMVTFPTPDGKKGSAYVVMSSKPTNNYLIITHEWWGLNDYIKQRADELQRALGNVNVIAVDMYDGKVTANADSAGKIMGSVSDTRVKDILKGAIAYAGTNASIISMGWCFGGGYALQTAILAGKQAAGCVMYYGMPEKDTNKLKTLNCQVLGLFAKQDKWITPEVVQNFQENMKKEGKTLIVKMYDANHAFANPSNPAYNKEAAEEANKEALTFITRLFE